MIYKINVVQKSNLSEIRYLLVSDEISSAINRLSKVDAIRDIANTIMKKQGNIDYVNASNMAKEIVDNKQMILPKENIEKQEELVEKPKVLVKEQHEN